MFDGRPVLTQLGSSAAITPEIAIAMKVTRGQRGGLLFTWPLVKSSSRMALARSSFSMNDADSRQQVMLLTTNEVLLCNILGRTPMAYAKSHRTINTAA